MFVTYLSNQNCEERYWPFVFRFETIVAGVVTEVAKRIVAFTDEQAQLFFQNAFAAALDDNSNVLPPGWWSRVESPPYLWFQKYLERELPFMIAESRRLADESLPETERIGENQTSHVFDQSKIRHCAHVSPSFRDFLRQC